MPATELLRDRVRVLAADIFGVDIDDLPDGASSETFPAWSSLNHMTLMASIEESCGLRLSLDEMTRLNSLDRIVAFLEQTSVTAAQ